MATLGGIMRGQQTVVLLAAILVAGAVIGGCLRDTKEADEVPITVTDSGVRVTLTSLKESDNLLVLTFRVENERKASDTLESVIDRGGVALKSDLAFVTSTYQENSAVDDGTASDNEPTSEIAVMVEKPADPSRPVSFLFSQVLVPTSTGAVPISVAGRWEFRFVPTAT